MRRPSEAERGGLGRIVVVSHGASPRLDGSRGSGGHRNAHAGDARATGGAERGKQRVSLRESAPYRPRTGPGDGSRTFPGRSPVHERGFRMQCQVVPRRDVLAYGLRKEERRALMRSFVRCLWLMAVALAPAIGCGGSVPRGVSSRPAASKDAIYAASQGPGMEKAASDSMGKGDYVHALYWRQRVLVLINDVYGVKSLQTAAALDVLGDVYHGMGRDDEAERQYKVSIGLTEAVDGPDSLRLSEPINDLARVYIEHGRYKEGQDILMRLLKLQDRKLGSKNPATAETGIGLGHIFLDTGYCEAAYAMFKVVKTMLETAGEVDSPRFADATEGLGGAATCLQKYDEAQHAYERVLAIRERLLVPEHVSIVETLLALSRLLRFRHAYDQAESFLKRALAVERSRVNPEPQQLIEVLKESGLLLMEGRHDFGGAHRVLAEALERQEKLNPTGLVPVLDLLAVAEWGEGDLSGSIQTMSRVIDGNEKAIDSGLQLNPFAGIGVDYEILRPQTFNTYQAISLALTAGGDNLGRRTALLSILRGKARILELSAEGARVLRQHLPPTRFEQFLESMRGEAQVEFEGLAGDLSAEESATRMKPFEDIAAGLRDEARTWASGSPTTAVSIEKVAAALPPDGALVELASFVPLVPASDTVCPAHYAAFVLHPDARIDQVDLGEVDPIDADAAKLRAALADPSRDPKDAARALDEHVMRPIRGFLSSAHHLFMAPDGALSLVPFGALLDEQGEYLLRRYVFTSLTTGRELLRIAAPAEPSPSGPVVVADPDFGDAAAAAIRTPTGKGSRSVALLARAVFPPLPGTRREGEAVAAALGVKPLAGAQATDAAIQALHGPRILHMATHGFFVHDERSSAPVSVSRGLRLDQAGGSAPPPAADADAMYRSALVLAGANLHRPEDDGILTAAEVAWLDLKGTELVVLSACETGLGETWASGGVYGLQQALLKAGARSFVMSLWKVSDQATGDLMVDFYNRLLAGESRADALRSAQLRIAASPGRAHPYYWATFVQYGDPSRLVLTVR